MGHTFEYLDKPNKEIMQNLYGNPQKDAKTKWKTVILEGSRLRGAHHLFSEKKTSQDHFIKEINNLIDRSYDNYRYKAHQDTNHVFCGVFDKDTKDLLGLMVLLRKNCRGAEYCEFGVSLVDERYRGQGIQTITAKEMQNYAITLLEQGYPLYSTARSFSAHTQYQLHNIRLPDKAGRFVPLGTSRGFAPYYVFEKDESGEFFLEFHMLYDSWRTLNEIVSKLVYLPPIALEKRFYIFNPEHRPDVQPLYAYPMLHESGKIEIEILSGESVVFPEIDYTRSEWTPLLAESTSIIGHEEDVLHVKKSPTGKFDYSDTDSPSRNLRVVQIEAIHAFDFAKDFDDSMVSINLTVQIADFEEENKKAANLALLDILLKHNFVPAAVHDILVHGKRVRVALLSRWKGIKVQSKFEVLQGNKKTFDIFKHDCNVQGYVWPMILNVLLPDHFKEKDKTTGRGPDLLNLQFPTLTKNVAVIASAPPRDYLSCFLGDTPFYTPLEHFCERFRKNALLTFRSDYEELDRAFFEQFEKVLGRIADHFAPYIRQENGVDSFSIKINGKFLQLKLENKYH